MTSSVRAIALLADLAAVLAFATAGRASHEPGEAVTVVLTIAWPFAVAALGAHAVLLNQGRDATSLRSGAVVVAATFVVGMGCEDCRVVVWPRRSSSWRCCRSRC